MDAEHIITAVIAAFGGSALTAIVNYLATRNKTKAETSDVAASSWVKLVNQQRSEMDRLKLRVNELESKVEKLEGEADTKDKLLDEYEGKLVAAYAEIEVLKRELAERDRADHIPG